MLNEEEINARLHEAARSRRKRRSAAVSRQAAHNFKNPIELSEPEINEFLSHLASVGKYSASTQNQALSALLFLYRHVYHREVGDLGNVTRAR
jgi:site-specific recombinase XerD